MENNGKYLTEEVREKARENTFKINESGKKHGLNRRQLNTLKIADNITAVKAIRLWCYQCSGFTREECTTKGCPLYLYRKPGAGTAEEKEKWHKAFNKSWADLGELPNTTEIGDITYSQILEEAGVTDDELEEN